MSSEILQKCGSASRVFGTTFSGREFATCAKIKHLRRRGRPKPAPTVEVELKDFREEATFSTWVRRIATHTALNVLRKRRGLRTVSLDESGEDSRVPPPELIADWRGDPARIVEERELREILAEAVDSLPEKYRLVFVLRDIEGLSVEETADLLSITPANVKVRLLRARLALREKLTAVFGDRSKAAAHRPHS